MDMLFSNARMYAVTPQVEAAWRGLLEQIFARAEVDFSYFSYPAPQPLEDLWSRPDLGCVFMCGYPIALQLADIIPLAAPIPSLDWAKGQALYRSDLIVREEAPFSTLESTFGHRAGWTVEHSHSGFNAFRHHLLFHRTAQRPKLFSAMNGPLITARRILDAVRDGEIDIGPLDGYWHALIARHAPLLVKGIRVLESTALAPIPAFVAGRAVPEPALLRLKESFAAAARASWFFTYADPLLLKGFATVSHQDFAVTLAWDREAKDAGYPFPA
jgi:ABC-type phosphate/phosphonate transport system substrate-binding protein